MFLHFLRDWPSKLNNKTNNNKNINHNINKKNNDPEVQCCQFPQYFWNTGSQL